MRLEAKHRWGDDFISGWLAGLLVPIRNEMGGDDMRSWELTMEPYTSFSLAGSCGHVNDDRRWQLGLKLALKQAWSLGSGWALGRCRTNRDDIR